METIQAYLERKHRELGLLNDCLRHRLDLPRPRSVDEVISAKFQLTAALRAEHELHEWKATETAWSHTADPVSGPFEFSYDYQRADLTVRGPSFYELDCSRASTAIYTASGMAAISAVLLASAQIVEKADILVLPGSYGETLELIRGFVPHLRLVALELPLGDALARTNSPRILLLDSCSVAGAFEAVQRCDGSGLDLLICDTTCFAGRSGRIRRVRRWAQRYGIPLVLVRSHNKLDSLGAEYGRLGSAVFVDGNEPRTEHPWARLACETRNAVRLLGGAALPAHFPPFVGSAAYWDLTQRRVAAILRNGRSMARHFAAELPEFSAELHFAHGLYVTLRGRHPLDEASARQAAADMSKNLRAEGFPIRHAGSFGFDFAATEWFHDATTDRYSVRVAVSDLPTEVWGDLTVAIARWWRDHQSARVGEE
ncbi:hypothetical protein C7U92_15660 [Bradyrhizobium sp. WBOS7]|uniref:Uncharacterized protein n=1 Tax=Bradyrhizobium betae TaxID=244734 RepID=A0AAE9NEC3_9BRAD|nr:MULTISPECIES: hypothetical protein [Bradyrhizobium]MDD1572204.1 hypothetical protein [Bradyrhizobium sp. WBOS1]UUO37000.1 hypothetical protein DCK84_22120 [Bradyrhizobium sp. WBOS01]MDD1529065.1 hypothetical protein [Bradyrhizobium sp. WBOS2]MDD1578158.1 hypothetical protein [Bradyrhizobium sp. WBOS7]MDD1601464.1 hypothetical protein [Bradyrhizobium sp. WBOS16]